jgi:hypothetical protein
LSRSWKNPDSRLIQKNVKETVTHALAFMLPEAAGTRNSPDRSSDVTPSLIQFCSCMGGFGDNRRDWLELAIQFLFEGALFRRGRSLKTVDG